VMGCEEIRGSDARWLGILRMATEKKVEEKFRKAVENFPEDLEWWAREKVAEVVRCPPPGRPGVFCRSGMAVDCPAYLTALWECCRASNNVKWTILEIKSLRELSSFDAAVVSAGAYTLALPELWGMLPIRPVRGQAVAFADPGGARPAVPMISGKYLVPIGTGVVGGGTVEHFAEEGSLEDFREFAGRGKDLEVAAHAIRSETSEKLYTEMACEATFPAERATVCFLISPMPL